MNILYVRIFVGQSDLFVYTCTHLCMYIRTYVRMYLCMGMCIVRECFPGSNGAVIAIVVVIIVLILCACIIMDILFCYCCKRKGRHDQNNGTYACTVYMYVCMYVHNCIYVIAVSNFLYMYCIKCTCVTIINSNVIMHS